MGFQLGETINNVIGTTFNPVNQLLSCGGSSGGVYSTLLRYYNCFLIIDM